MSYINPVPLKKDGYKTPEMQRIYTMLLKSLRFSNNRFSNWDNRPNCGYYFSGCQWYNSDQNRMAAYTAFMSCFGEYDEDLAGISRDELRERAIKVIRYSCFTHDTGPEDCVRVNGANKLQSGTKWGGNMISAQGHRARFFQGTQVGVGMVDFLFSVWALWEYLDEETRQMAYNVVADYAERWYDYEPRDGVYHDTQAEENAWTACGIYAISVVFGNDPRSEKWRAGALQWMIDSASVPTDRLSEEKLSNGKTFAQSIGHITLHPDFSTENHAILHPDYLAAPVLFRSVMLMFAVLTGDNEPDGIRHNWRKIYDNMLLICAAEDGGVIPIQSQDWWYFKMYEFMLTHTATRIFFEDAYAANLEMKCIDSLEKAQLGNPMGTFLDKNPDECMVDSNPLNYQTLADSEPSVCAYLWKVYLMHMASGSGVLPVDDAEYEEKVSTVHKFPFGGSVLKRLPDTFSTCAFRNSAMAFVLPKDSTWTITAPPCSTFGEMIFENGCPENPGLSNQTIIRTVEKAAVFDNKNSYGVRMSIDRGVGRIKQDVTFVTLQDGNVVYFQRVRALKDCKIKGFTSGLVGVRNEHFEFLPQYAKGYRTLNINDDTSLRMDGYLGEKDNIFEFSNVRYAALDDKMLYLIHNSNGVKYINHHYYPKWKGIEDFLVLNSYDRLQLNKGEELPLFAMAFLPNKGIEAAKDFEFTVSCAGNADAAVLNDVLVYSNRENEKTEARAEFSAKWREIPIFVGENSYKNGAYSWSALLLPNECGHRELVAKVPAERDFHAVALPNGTVLIKYGDDDSYHTL